jgi:hypothetical protein
MMTKLLDVWDWRFAVVGTTTSGFFVTMESCLGVIALLLSILSASATLLLTMTKLFDWIRKRSQAK